MTSQVDGENLVIFFDERVDTKNAAEVEAAIKKFAAANPALNLEFDAENLEYISSVGLRILLKFRKLAKKKSGRSERFKGRCGSFRGVRLQQLFRRSEKNAPDFGRRA